MAQNSIRRLDHKSFGTEYIELGLWPWGVILIMPAETKGSV